MPVLKHGSRLTVFGDKVERRMTFDLPPESFGWEDVNLTSDELDALVDYADAGMVKEASEIVDGAYARLFGGETVH